MAQKQEQIILDKVRQLSPEHLREVLDFIEFLQQRELQQQWVGFDEWAMNLAQERGFQHLTEENVAQIVETHRRRACS